MDTLLKKASNMRQRLTPTQVKNIATNVGASPSLASALKNLQNTAASLGRTGIEVAQLPEKIIKTINILTQYTQVFLMACIFAVIVGSIYSVLLKRQKIRAISTATKATGAVVAYANVGGRQMMNKALNTVKNMEQVIHEEVKRAQDRLEKIRDEVFRLNLNRSNVNQAKLESLMDKAEKQYKDSLSRLAGVVDIAATSANRTLGGNSGAKLIAGASLAASHILNEARKEQKNLNKPSTSARAIAYGVAVASTGGSAAGIGAAASVFARRSPSPRRRSTNRNNQRSSTPLRLGQS